ncbi:MAG: hypothetical protein HY796_03170 [Elusimicrobia bacterium]|nr:hypothetical protein [Elusimicrobiota bacterium]
MFTACGLLPVTHADKIVMNMPNGRKMFVHVSGSFVESDRIMADYYASLTCEEKLDIGQYLREQYYKIRGIVAGRMDKTIVYVSQSRPHKADRRAKRSRSL